MGFEEDEIGRRRDADAHWATVEIGWRALELEFVVDDFEGGLDRHEGGEIPREVDGVNWFTDREEAPDWKEEV